jgi:hypothetical protein
MADAKSFYEQQKLIADNEAQIILQKADARLEIAKNKSKAFETEADAEKENSSKMEGERMHREKMFLAR